jgi:methionyl aminopeptidase
MISIKTPQDIEFLKEGGKRHAEILKILKALVVPGVSTVTLNEKAMELVKEGGDVPAFLGYKPEGVRRPYPAALCVSVNDEIVHGIPNESPKILQEGDVVTLDLGLTHHGMITDSAITVGVGTLSEEDARLISATEEALYAGIKEAKFGNTIGDIGYAIESVAKRYKLALALGLAGHGVGYEVHEDPFVPNSGVPGHGPKLKPGMVIAIEPMLVLGKGDIILLKDGYTYKTRDGKKAAHSEHTILITDGNPVILTKS